MTELRELLREGIGAPATPLDLGAAIARARGFRARRRGAAIAGAVMVVAIALAAVPAFEGSVEPTVRTVDQPDAREPQPGITSPNPIPGDAPTTTARRTTATPHDATATTARDATAARGATAPTARAAPSAPVGESRQGAIAYDAEIAFRRAADIYVMNGDGSNPRKLRAGAQPAWSPDGKLIAFTDRWDGGDIQLMNADGSGHQNLRVRGDSPTWSPDGGHLAFNWECDAQFGGPCTSPDGSEKDCGPECGIAVIARNGTGVRHIGNGMSPDWGPDGRIIFTDGTPVGPCQYRTSDVMYLAAQPSVLCALPIWVMNADGSGRTKLPIDRAISPRWSPDGRRIAYHTDDGVFVANSDGTGVVKVAPAGDGGASWSPDGRWLALVRFTREGPHSIYLRSSDGSNERRLTFSGDDAQPAFSRARAA